MKKIISLSLISLFLLLGCGNPQLKNGEEVVAEIDDLQVTADEIYQEMKRMYGAGATVELIDNFIANAEVETTDEIKAQADEMIEMYKMQNQDQDWEELLISSGFRNEAELRDTLINNFKREQALKKFVMRNLSEDDLIDYYENDYHGQMDVRHILIQPDENTEDNEAALDEAYEKAVSIIEQLDDGADFIALVEEYSDDLGAEEGLIPNVTLEDYVDDFYFAAKALEVDEYTQEPVQTQFGYHIILKIHEEEKQPFDDAQENIRETLAQRTIEQMDDQKFRRLWNDLRQEYNLTIHDDDIRAVYNENFLFID